MLADQIKADMDAALKAGEKLQLSTLRMLVSEINYKKIAAGRELEDADVVEVIQKEVKKRREAVQSYTAGGRAEQAQTEEEERRILEIYLPKQLTKIEIRAELVKMNLPKDFAGAMKMAAPVFKGRADGKEVAETVRELCQ